jgi:glycosyltransferase involved in cell wall biosynthesis
MIDAITPLVVTLDEAPNIARTLDKLTWARRIVVVDSGSVDGTIKIVNRYPQVDRFDRPFDSFAEQCNFGLAQVRTDWVLSLDADYELSDDLVRELAELKPQTAAGFRASFVYRIDGQSLRGRADLPISSEKDARAVPQLRHPAYIPGIDGLRAVAVLSVMLYHLDPRIVPGGFVGVDVFFAASSSRSRFTKANSARFFRCFPISTPAACCGSRRLSSSCCWWFPRNRCLRPECLAKRGK